MRPFVTGPTGFGFTHPGLERNSSYAIERDSAGAVISIGELLLPGEILLARGEPYHTPWLQVAAGTGIDGVSAAFHAGLRALPAYTRL